MYELLELYRLVDLAVPAPQARISRRQAETHLPAVDRVADPHDVASRAEAARIQRGGITELVRSDPRWSSPSSQYGHCSETCPWEGVRYCPPPTARL